MREFSGTCAIGTVTKMTAEECTRRTLRTSGCFLLVSLDSDLTNSSKRGDNHKCVMHPGAHTDICHMILDDSGLCACQY